MRMIQSSDPQASTAPIKALRNDLNYEEPPKRKVEAIHNQRYQPSGNQSNDLDHTPLEHQRNGGAFGSAGYVQGQQQKHQRPEHQYQF
jgi:hypothetical protein